MSRRRRIDKTDSNQKDIVDALREIPGISVITGMDDILIGYKGFNYWIEIKDPLKVGKDGTPHDKSSKTAKKQAELKDTWPGSYAILSNLDQILEHIGIS